MREPDQFEQLSLDDLISRALSESDEDTQWEVVFSIRDQLCEGALEQANHLCRSDCPLERTLGARIFGGGMRDRCLQECIDGLLALLKYETDADVISAGLSALGNVTTWDPRPNVAVIGAAIGHVAHPNGDVRYAVVHALCSNLRADSIDALIQLTTDTDTQVRGVWPF